MLTIRRKKLFRRRYSVIDSRGYAMELHMNVMREHGSLDDGDRVYSITRIDEQRIAFCVDDDEFADATGDMMRWVVATADQELHLEQPNPLIPQTNVLSGGVRIGEIVRTKSLREQVEVRLSVDIHPAVLAFIGAVAIIAWRRVVAEGSFESTFWTLE